MDERYRLKLQKFFQEVIKASEIVSPESIKLYCKGLTVEFEEMTDSVGYVMVKKSKVKCSYCGSYCQECNKFNQQKKEEFS